MFLNKNFKQKSFRDPTGYVLESNNKIYRVINIKKRSFYENLFNQEWYQKFVGEKKIQHSQWIDNLDNDPNYCWIEHKKFDFGIFPNEFCAEQLYEAASLTLEIAIKAFSNKIILKDTSAWNVIFDSSKPTFCDVTSFEEWKGEKLWFAYGQFNRHFIIPLILYKNLKINIAKLFLTNRDGIKPEDAQAILGLKTIKSICAIESITLPTLFKNKGKKNFFQNSSKLQINEKLFLGTLNRLKKYIISLQPSKLTSNSVWSEYQSTREHYSNQDLEIKRTFIQKGLMLGKSPVLDLGCNQGEYSFLAEKMGLKVVATDNDELSIIKLQSKLNSEKITVCFLDICHPTPSIGWDNKEHSSFLERSRNQFGLVLCLGLLHHLIVTERIPLNYILDTFLNITKEYLIIEFVDPEDEKFKEISRFNKDLNLEFTKNFFDISVKKKFTILKSIDLKDAKRSLYLLKKH